jgi:heptosyltransferase I
MRIAIVKLSAIGDIIHTMVVLQFIKKEYPKSKIDWFIDNSLKGVLENNPHINQINSIRFREARKKKSIILIIKEVIKLRKLPKYDLVIDIQNLIKSALVAKLIPSKKTIGLDKYSSRERFASVFYSYKYSINHSLNIIKRNTSIINKALDINISNTDIDNKNPFLFFEDSTLEENISKESLNILLIPGASFESKMYPLEKLAQISKKINANFIILWGSESEKIIAEKIKRLSPRVCVVKKLSLDKLKALISQVNLVIGPDTGPTHMAWALNIPSITLFGPTPGYRNVYLTKINRIIESKSEVNPLRINKNDFSIKDINVDDVVSLSQDLLNATRSKV